MGLRARRHGDAGHLWQGGADHRVPPAWAQRLADASRRSSVRLLPDEGHVLLLSQGEQVLRDLVSS